MKKSAISTFFLPSLKNFLYDGNCNKALPNPCAESYEGFNKSKMNLEMSTSKYFNCRIKFLSMLNGHNSAFIPIDFFVARKPKQALATIILPLLVIGLLAAFGALIPISSGEKYGLVDYTNSSQAMNHKALSIKGITKVKILDNCFLGAHILFGLDELGNGPSWSPRKI